MQKRINRARSIAVNIPITIFLSILALLVLIPILWIILGTFKPEKEIISYPPTFIPHALTLENFASVSGRIKIWRYAINSLIYAGGTTTIAMFVNSLAGYVYARFTFKGKTVCFLLTLATMMVPFQVIMVPLFLIVFNLGMYDTYWALIIPRVAVATSIFMMRAAFSGLPKELEDAGRIDGLSEFGIFLRIMLPQVKPALICLFILSFNGSWNDLLWPMLAASSTNMRTLANGLALFVGEYTVQYGAAFAGTVISLVPMLLLYIFGQKYFVQGMASSGLK